MEVVHFKNLSRNLPGEIEENHEDILEPQSEHISASLVFFQEGNSTVSSAQENQPMTALKGRRVEECLTPMLSVRCQL